jgi:predicted ATP-grasp superfamily ATP-dependent carboligase
MVIRVLQLPSHELLDKTVLEARAPAAGLRCPPSRTFVTGDDLLAAAAELDYPVVVKAASYHRTRRASGPADLERWRGVAGPLLVQPFLPEAQHSVSGVIWEGQMVAAVHQRYLRTWPADPGGHAAAACTIEPDTELESKMLRLLSDHEGPFQAQLRGDYLLDLNPRVSTSLPLAVAAGVNLPAIYCDLRRGIDVPERRGRPGVFYRWLDGDVRSVIWAWRRRRMSTTEAVRALAPRAGTAHGPESLLDPGPIVARVLAARRKVGRGLGGGAAPSPSGTGPRPLGR